MSSVFLICRDFLHSIPKTHDCLMYFSISKSSNSAVGVCSKQCPYILYHSGIVTIPRSSFFLYTQGQRHQHTKSSHMWNSAYLGGHWYLLDVFWVLVDLNGKLVKSTYTILLCVSVLTFKTSSLKMHNLYLIIPG